MLTKEICQYYCHKPPLIFSSSILYIATRTKAVVKFASTRHCVSHTGHRKQSNWKTLTLSRTGGQTTFLLRSECPFSHYAAALIYRNTKIRLNEAIFSFAFGGHFSCLENSSHSNSTRGSIVIIACFVRVWRPGLRSLADTHGPQQEFTLHHPLCGVAMGQQ